jgi:1-acyl-sn-glycerol-3-phosphate acyltransferase
MNIGLDIDGVLINQEKFQLQKGIKHFKKNYIKKYYKDYGIKLKKTNVQVLDSATGKQFNGNQVDLTKPYIEINSNGYGIADVFNCSENEEAKFWYKYMIPYALFASLRKDAARVIKQLYNEGNKIIPVTARAKANENTIIGKIQRGLVILRLKINRIPYDKIVYCSYKKGQELQDKVSACIDNKLELMIEDKKGNAEAIDQQTNTKTFLYATRNNADIKNKNILRFVNFGELYNGIKKEKEEEKFTLLHKEEKNLMTPEQRENYYKEYRNYHTKYIYDKGIIIKREENLKKLIKYGKYFFDKTVKYKIINEDKKPKEDGIIITTNHRDMLDIPLVISTIGIRPYHPMLKAEFLDTKAEGVLTDIGCFFVNKHDKSIREQARETATKMVLSGSNVIVCPEGTRNKTDKLLLNFDFGAVSIAQNSGKLIYPCAIYRTNDYRIINFGDSIKVGINDNLEEANQILFNKTIELLEECARMEEEKSSQVNQESNNKVKYLSKK